MGWRPVNDVSEARRRCLPRRVEDGPGRASLLAPEGPPEDLAWIRATLAVPAEPFATKLIDADDPDGPRVTVTVSTTKLHREFDGRDIQQPAATAVVVEAGPNGEEITDRFLKSLPVSELVALACVDHGWEVTAHDGPGSDLRLAAATGPAPADVERAVREHWNTPAASRLLEVAEVYNAATRAPQQAVADHFGYSLRWAGARIKEAREYGFLPPTTQGRATNNDTGTEDDR